MAFKTLGDITTPALGPIENSGGSRTDLAYQVKAGIEYEAVRKGNVYVEYKYFGTTGDIPFGVNAAQVGYRQGF